MCADSSELGKQRLLLWLRVDQPRPMHLSTFSMEVSCMTLNRHLLIPVGYASASQDCCSSPMQARALVKPAIPMLSRRPAPGMTAFS